MASLLIYNLTTKANKVGQKWWWHTLTINICHPIHAIHRLPANQPYCFADWQGSLRLILKWDLSTHDIPAQKDPATGSVKW